MLIKFSFSDVKLACNISVVIKAQLSILYASVNIFKIC